MTASAHTPADPAAVKDLGRLASLSNLVVQTKVTNVTYRLSAGGANGAKPMPYTFVTFAISGVVQGSTASKSLTLKFAGGPDGQGGFLSVEGVPTFQVGDQDILFVANNGLGAGCALVMCEFGRFRVAGNAVYGAHGEPILAVNSGKLTVGNGYGPDQFHTVRYPTPSFDEMMKNPGFAAAVRSAGAQVDARALYEAQAPKSISITERDSAGIDGALSTAAASTSKVSLGQFMSSVGLAVSANALKAGGSVQSASVSAPLAVPPASPAAPPAGSAAGASVSPGPVIKKN